MYRYAPHNDVSVNDGPHIRRWSRKIIIQNYNSIMYYNIILYYNTYHCVTIAHSIQYSKCCTGL